MPKNTTNNLEVASLAEQNKFRMLVTMFLDSATLYLCANDTGNIIFNGITYESVNITRTDIPSSVAGISSDERVSLTLSDVSGSVAEYCALNGNLIHNRRCLIQEVDLDYLTDPLDIVTIFDGIMDNLSFTIGVYKVDVIRQLSTYAQECPFMTYGPTCQYKKFKDERCKYTGAATTCDRTLTVCKNYANSLNYGGKPSIPDEMQIRW